MIPPTHPRYESLRIREMLAGGFEAGAVASEGLMAHGRGEAFDYMLGEESTITAQRAAHAAAAALLLSKKARNIGEREPGGAVRRRCRAAGRGGRLHPGGQPVL